MRFIWLFLFCASTLFSQTTAEDSISNDPLEVVPLESESKADTVSSEDRIVASLRAQLEAIEINRGEVIKLDQMLAGETNEVSRADAVEQLEKATDELNILLSKFQENAAGVDISLFQDKPKEAFSWEEQLGEILRPILAEMENATSLSRKIADLRQEEERFAERATVAGRAAEQVNSLLGNVSSAGPLAEALQLQLEFWSEKEKLAGSQAESASLQLENLESQEEGLLAGSTTYIREFMQKRGLNLVIGIGSALAVFFAVRLVLAVVRRARKTENPKNFGSRVFVLTANLISVIGAVAAMLVAFSATGDLFLFGIVLLFLLGVAWGGIKVLPQFVESLKLILNIGMVKEGERLEFDGIPWNVESLGFSSRLVNSLLDDAVQVLPVRHLVGHHSRAWCADEAEFPCKRGEWVQLSDGKLGRIVAQNPNHVLLQELGGAAVTYATPDFLAVTPRNLSEGEFRVETRFGIDYKHQQDCTGSIPGIMARSVRSGVEALVGKEAIRDVQVQFASAGASSLDYEVEVDLSGSAAPLYEKVQYGLQRILVDCCNENGWEIPFQQITIHRTH